MEPFGNMQSEENDKVVLLYKLYYKQMLYAAKQILRDHCEAENDAGQKQRNRDIVLYTELLNQIESLKNIADAFVPEFRALCFRHFSKIGAVYNHAAGAWTYKAGDKIQQGGFTLARGTVNSYKLSLGKGQIQVPENRNFLCFCLKCKRYFFQLDIIHVSHLEFIFCIGAAHPRTDSLCSICGLSICYIKQ